MIGPLDVANTILNHGFKEDIDISPMKLQKLVYFLYKKYYQETDKLLFTDNFVAFKTGIVNLQIYEEFKKYGSNHIKDYYREQKGEVFLIDVNKYIEFTNVFYYVWDKYKRFAGPYLASLTKKEDSAWHKAVLENLDIININDIYNEEWYQ